MKNAWVPALFCIVIGLFVLRHEIHIGRGESVRITIDQTQAMRMFRGEPLTLSTALNRIKPSLLGHAQPFEKGQVVYVAVEATSGEARPIAIHGEPGKLTLRGKVEAYLKSTWNEQLGRFDAAPELRVRYGFEKVVLSDPINEALLHRSERIEIELAVDAGGRSVVRAIYVDGVQVHHEGMFSGHE